MSAKEIAKTYVQKLQPVSLTTDVTAKALYANDMNITGYTMAGLRHNWFTNYTEVCLELDEQAALHSRLYFENIKSKFKELVNSLVLDMLVQAVIKSNGKL